ncbi:MAG TPA: glycoside hydrolase family 57 protein [Bacteroidales bacterium]|nr:glycoside hydrolase family 57 protein [Bacteroidales bacterium]
MSSVQKKAICLYFEVHQPFRLKRYRFFDLGHDHYYYDDYSNESILRKIADKCYLPANNILLDQISKHKGKFRIAFSLSGIVLDQFRLYAPEVLESFRKLAQTGMVEFLAETEAHSLASLKSKDEFIRQVKAHSSMIKEHLGVEPTSFRNTELIYSDQIGSWVADLGFKATLTEGAKHVLGWKSPNYLYCNSINPRLKVLLRNFVLSDDIAFRFSNKSWNEWPLTTDKYVGWINKLAPKSELLNIFIDYETFGEHHWKESGIFDFLSHLPGAIIKKTPFKFMTPSEVADNLQPVASINVPSPISWADEERDITAWLGNELQSAAFDKLYELKEKVSNCNYEQLKKDWTYLQSSDHFYYMCTKFFSDGAVHAYFNPYETPYDAFMNYMNVLSDFEIRINRMCPATEDQIEILKLDSQLKSRDETIAKLQSEIVSLRDKSPAKPRAARKTTVKAAAKTAEKKTVRSLAEIAAEALAKSNVKTKSKAKAKPKTKTARTVKTAKKAGNTKVTTRPKAK